jgi:hypothetical protein
MAPFQLRPHRPDRQLDRPIRPLAKPHFPPARAKPDPSRPSATCRATQTPPHLGERLIATLPDHQFDRIEDRAFTALEFQPAIRPVAQPVGQQEGRRVHEAAYRENKKGTTVVRIESDGGSQRQTGAPPGARTRLPGARSQRPGAGARPSIRVFQSIVAARVPRKQKSRPSGAAAPLVPNIKQAPSARGAPVSS